jgi:uncharacterized protein (TIGR03790 family)
LKASENLLSLLALKFTLHYKWFWPPVNDGQCFMLSFKIILGLGLGLLIGWGFQQKVRADGREVVVVYNSAVPESKALAEYYAHARQVPPEQLFGFPLATGLDISRDEFRAKLHLPLAVALAAKGLWQWGDVVVPYDHGVPKHNNRVVVSSKIRYLVLCYGVPVRIDEDATIHERLPDNFPPQFHANTAAVDSELAWLPLLHLPVLLTGPLPNWIYANTNQARLNPTNGVLLVARLDGPTPKIARGLVDKAMAAERDGLWGRAYCDARGLVPADPYYHGDQLMLGAAEICQQLGYDTSLDTNSATFPAEYPLSHVAIYCGWYDGNVSGPFTLPEVEFMPGAFAYHLHSYSAADIRSPTSNWVGPLLAKGATCTMGCVSEPYLTLTPDVSVFLHVLAHGWTFGEAAWTAQPALSWQTTVVGDPLYCPFAKPPLEYYRELKARQSPLLDWAMLHLMNLDLVHGAPLDKISETLEQLPATSQSAVLTQKLAELSDAQGKPSAAIDYYERALNLKPSRQQRIGIRLVLGRRLVAQNRLAEARDNYQQLLAEVPDYPGKETIVNDLQQLH